MQLPNKDINLDIDYGDYYDIWYIPFYKTYIGILVIISSFIISIIILIFLYRYFISKRRKSPEYIAKKDLNNLIIELKKNNINYSRIYEKLTSIIKNYFQAKYKIIFGVTDLEFLNYLKKINYKDNNIKNNIINLFINAEKIKYFPNEFKNKENTPENVIKSNLEKDIKNSLEFISNLSKTKENNNI